MVQFRLRARYRVSLLSAASSPVAVGSLHVECSCSTAFHCLSLTSDYLSTAFSTAFPLPFLGLPLPFYCLSLASHYISTAFP